nr:MAG TPA: hypothetical protein [Caudoviricetes sp.]
MNRKNIFPGHESSLFAKLLFPKVTILYFNHIYKPPHSHERIRGSQYRDTFTNKCVCFAV